MLTGHTADLFLSVPMTLSDLERRDARNQIFRRISLIALEPFDVEDKIWQDNTRREGRISRGKPRPYCKGAGPQRSPILAVPFYLCVHPLTQNYQI